MEKPLTCAETGCGDTSKLASCTHCKAYFCKAHYSTHTESCPAKKRVVNTNDNTDRFSATQLPKQRSKKRRVIIDSDDDDDIGSSTTTTSAPKDSKNEIEEVKHSTPISTHSGTTTSEASIKLLNGSVGFEWQLTKKIYCSSKDGPLPSKVVVTIEGPAHIESDQADVEIVSAPLMWKDGKGLLFTTLPDHMCRKELSSHLELKDARIFIHDAAELLLKKSLLDKSVFTGPSQPITAHAVFKGKELFILAKEGLDAKTVTGTMQATVGIELHRLVDLLELAGIKAFCFDCRHAFNLIIKRASPTLKGFCLLCCDYAKRFAEFKADTTDGPKGALMIMARTDFHTMYRDCLSPNDKDDFRTFVKAHGAKNSCVFFPKGYKVEDKIIPGPGPDLGEWFDSIIDPTSIKPRWRLKRQKDILSPPPAFLEHSPGVFTHAMGADGLVHGLALFELRQLRLMGFGDHSKTFDQMYEAYIAISNWVFGLK